MSDFTTLPAPIRHSPAEQYSSQLVRNEPYQVLVASLVPCAIASMLHKIGLLPAHNTAQIPLAYQAYKDDPPEGWKMSVGSKKAFCINASVYFVGVFDCVASVGFVPRKLPFSSTPTSMTGHFRHAMALDEHRAKFKVSRWQRNDKKGDFEDWAAAANEEDTRTQHWQRNGLLERSSRISSIQRSAGQLNGAFRKRSTISETENGVSEEPESNAERLVRLAHTGKQPDVLEVWFTGCHANVGGGAVPNDERHVSSRIPLRWMIRQCFDCDTVIVFDSHGLAETGNRAGRSHRLACV